jgi:hypothetical protein
MKSKINCEQANQIDLVEYLEKLDHLPKKIRNNDYWYLSPLRDEKEPSFKVNRQFNIWYDHGLGKGGNVVDFGILYFNCPVKEFLLKLGGEKGMNYSPRIKSLGNCETSSSEQKITIIANREIAHGSIVAYLRCRQIPLDVARKFCEEVDFELNGKSYFAVGFKNSSGGYELRNQYFKGSSSPKDVTFFENGSKEISVFEGFFSFLSFQTHQLQHKNFLPNLPKLQTNYLILNSLSFFERSRAIMEAHQKIHLFLDCDNAGLACKQKALQWSDKYIDHSHHYSRYKDLNECLVKTQKRKLDQRPGHRLRF